MTSMNSDSSDDENEGYTTTNVLLGYASKEPTDDPISQLGGYPVSTQTHKPQAKASLIMNRHGQTANIYPQRFLQNARSAVASWSCSYSSMAIFPSGFPAMNDEFTSSPADRRHAKRRQAV